MWANSGNTANCSTSSPARRQGAIQADRRSGGGLGRAPAAHDHDRLLTLLRASGGSILGRRSLSLFAFIGLLPWTFFANAISGAGMSVVGSERLVTKVYFPD